MTSPSDIVVTIWHKPHHYEMGFVKTVHFWFDEDCILIQEQASLRGNRIDENQSFSESKRNDVPLDKISDLLAKVIINPLKEFESNMLGSSFYGLCIEIGSRSTTIEWEGRQSSIDQEVINVFKYIKSL